MELTSISFYIFFAVSLAVYFMAPANWQWILLLADSLFFYYLSAVPWTFIYLFISVCSVYLCTIYIESTNRWNKFVLACTVILNFGLLAVLKYSKLFAVTIYYISKFFNQPIAVPVISWTASLGISFYTLQMVSYCFDCYWGVVKTEHNFLKLLLYACYFPQMISGPISRYGQVAPQILTGHKFDYQRVSYGLIRIGWGLFEKHVISDRLAVVVDLIYADTATYTGIYLWLAFLLFPLQLYTDFCGCMDIIMGVSECFGICLPENFKAPFFAETLQEFWQRWHITLGSWLKDYIMNPLLKSEFVIGMGDFLKPRIGKKWGKRIPVYFGMLILWLCMGIWHGSGWKYIIGEGVWYWMIIMVEQIIKPTAEKIYRRWNIKVDTKTFRISRILRTYLLFSIGMVFFRAESFTGAVVLLKASVSGCGMNILFDGSLYNLGLNMINRIILAVSLFALYKVDSCRYQGDCVREKLHSENAVGRWICYWGMILFLILSANLSTQEFLYAAF